MKIRLPVACGLLLPAVLSSGCKKATPPAVQSSGYKKAGTPAGLEDLFGPTLLRRDGTKVPVSNLSKAEVIGVYFSAHWCPPCRFFTPKLVQTYKELKKKGKAFEIVFVSADRSEEEMKRYMEEVGMPWLAVPFSSPKVKELARRYRVAGIPRLVILDKKLRVIAQNARPAVQFEGAAAFDKWLRADAASGDPQ